MWTRRAVDAALVGGLSAFLVSKQAEAAVHTKIVAFQTSPFPYDGPMPDTGRPFLDTQQGDQRAHTSPRGGVYLENPTYNDRSVLLTTPSRFAPNRAAIVIFLHGNLARLGRDVVARQHVVAQFAASGLDAVLVAPQFALDALDSSAGHFWDQGGFARFLDEAADHLATMTRHDRDVFAAMPVVIVAYSGGYNPAAAILERGGVNNRIAGLVLLDALYGEEPTFANWLVRSNGQVFFFSAFSPSSAQSNLALQLELQTRGVKFSQGLPAHLRRGTVAFLATDPLVHNDFLTRAWVPNPLRLVLSRISL